MTAGAGTPTSRVADHRVLMIDDDPQLLTLVPMLLRPLGCQIRAVNGSDEFFDAVRDWRPTHLLIDLNMPGMDGVEVLAELGRIGCRSSVVVTSGLGGRVLNAAERTGVNHGLHISGILAKPFRATDLREVISRPPPFDPGEEVVVAARDLRGAPVTADELSAAIARDQLSFALQPQIRLGDGRLTGFEALVRWEGRPGGPVTPDQFVPLAESAGLIGPLTDAMLDMSLTWYGATVDAGLDGHRPAIAINVSGVTLDDRDFVTRLTQRCARAGIDPGCVVVEITETTAMSNPDVALEMLTRLRVQGFKIALDDFGTGFSSMTALAEFPFSELKVDRSFVTGMLSSQDARAVVSTAIELGHRLGLRVTAEGVEDLATLERLQDMDCDQAQGYFIARPMPPADAAHWIQRTD